MDQTIITAIFTPELVSSVVLTVVGAMVTAAVAALRNFIRSKTTADQFQLLQDIAAEAVAFAEQGKVGGIVDDKKDAAMVAASAALQQAGITVDPIVLSAAIEAAVLKGFNSEYAHLRLPDTSTSTTVQPAPYDPVTDAS